MSPELPVAAVTQAQAVQVALEALEALEATLQHRLTPAIREIRGPPEQAATREIREIPEMLARKVSVVKVEMAVAL